MIVDVEKDDSSNYIAVVKQILYGKLLLHKIEATNRNLLFLLRMLPIRSFN
jgi:hypothetical protein